MSKKNFYIIISFLLVLIIGVVGYYIISQSIRIEEKDQIIKYELQTHEYFESKPKISKYFIDSVDELAKFYEIYSDQVDINKDYLKDHSVFIKVQEVNSGSIDMKLSSVNFQNNKVNFIIEQTVSGVGTNDMAFWYFVAIIPNKRLEGKNLSDWVKPSKISKSW